MTSPGERVPSMLDELKAWKRLVDEADYDDEPLYVTPEEINQLRIQNAVQEVEDMARGVYRPPSGAIGLFVGKPVIVDRQKAAEQRARWLHG